MGLPPREGFDAYDEFPVRVDDPGEGGAGCMYVIRLTPCVESARFQLLEITSLYIPFKPPSVSNVNLPAHPYTLEWMPTGWSRWRRSEGWRIWRRWCRRR